MSLDKRGYLILKKLASNPAISGIQLETELNLTRKQVSYSIQKINYHLIENGLEEIKRLKTGKFLISKEVIAIYAGNSYSYDESEYVFSEQERLILFSLILLEHKEELSINHFTAALKISKNTVLNDMKKLQTSLLDLYDLKLLYDRTKGYYLIGKEFDKRNFMIYLIRTILISINGEAILNSTLEIDLNIINELKKDVEEIENINKVRYTDDRVREIPYILYFLLLRIKLQKYLDVLPEDYYHLVGTSEYSSISHVFEKYKIENLLEKIFIVTQFQISSIDSKDTNDSKFEQELKTVAAEVLEKFENLVCLNFNDKETLLDALVQHCKPAIYRIRYDYHVEGNVLKLILPQHSYLFELTRYAIQPFEEMIGKTFPEEELAYITILFGGWMTKEGTLDILEKKKRAIVVCTNGISISNFLFLKLQDAFPEFEFDCALSSRNFYSYENEFDIVFSTIHLETNKIQFLVKSIMDESDIHNLRKKVFKELLNKNIYEVNSNGILNLIEKYVEIKDRPALISALKSYLGEITEKESVNQHHDNLIELPLSKLLTDETVAIESEHLDWREAITKASRPLLDSGSIYPSYVDKMISAIEKDKPIWTIADGLVLAHADIDAGVHHLGMSLLKFNEEIKIGGYMNASIIVIMATPNKDIHLKALYTLIDITENDEEFTKIKNAKTKEEILKIVSKER